MLQDKLIRLGTEKNDPCITISLNTHRTHPESAQDSIVLKNLCHEAAERLINDYGKRPVQEILDQLEHLPKDIDPNYNLDSLHIFLSKDTREILRSPWPSNANTVQIDDHFALTPLIKDFNRSREYLILALSLGTTHLYHALNDNVTEEVRGHGFPMPASRFYTTAGDEASDPKLIDNNIRAYMNDVDKALLQVIQDSPLSCVVISTPENFTKLLQVANRPSVYAGQAPIDYNKTAPHVLAAQAWEVMKSVAADHKRVDLENLKAAIPRGQVITDLREIWQAAREGRGDLLFVNHAFRQPVRMIDDTTFELVTDSTLPDVVDDITSQIAWEVIAKKGRAHFTAMEDMAELGPIALKTRY